MAAVSLTAQRPPGPPVSYLEFLPSRVCETGTWSKGRMWPSCRWHGDSCPGVCAPAGRASLLRVCWSRERGCSLQDPGIVLPWPHASPWQVSGHLRASLQPPSWVPGPMTDLASTGGERPGQEGRTFPRVGSDPASRTVVWARPKARYHTLPPHLPQRGSLPHRPAYPRARSSPC